jgi:hypothetical protein
LVVGTLAGSLPSDIGSAPSAACPCAFCSTRSDTGSP